MLPRLPVLASVRCKLVTKHQTVSRTLTNTTFIKQHQRCIHSTPLTFGRPARKSKKQAEVIDFSKDDGIEEKPHEGMTVHGIQIPKKLQHWFTDPYGKKSRRDDIQEKKVKRLKAIHDRSKMPSIYKKPREIDTGHYSWDGKKMLSVRQVRVAKYIQDELQKVIQEAKGGQDDHMSRIIVDEVEVTRDLRTATVFWSSMDVLSKEKYRLLLAKGNLVTVLRSKLAARISHMKIIPALEFVSSDVLIEKEKELSETETLLDVIQGKDGSEDVNDLDDVDERHLIPHERDLDLLKWEMEQLQIRSKLVHTKGIANMTQEDWDYLLEPTRHVADKLLLDKKTVAKLKNTPAPDVPEDTDVYVDDEEEAEQLNKQREVALKNRKQTEAEQEKVWSVIDLSRFKGIEPRQADGTLGSFLNEQPGQMPPDPPEDPEAELNYHRRKYRLYRNRANRKKRTGRTSRGSRS